MGTSPGKIFAFLFTCLFTVGAFSLIAEKLWGTEGRICISDNENIPCLRYFTLDEIIGYKAFADKKALIRAEADVKAAKDSSEKVLVDKMKSAEDTVMVLSTLADRSTSRFWIPQNNRSWWDEVFTHWESLRANKELYRILHYGDSQIEMDRITAELRSGLQKKFGGGGPGLVPPLQLIPAYTISQTSSETWRRFISYGISKDRFYNNHYGPLGMVFPFDSGYAHVSISSRLKKDSLLGRFDQVKVLTGRLQQPMGISISGKNFSDQIEVWSDDQEQLLQWDWMSPSRNINLSFTGDSTSVILGIALDSKYGIVVDNIPWRGSSGLTFTGISKSSLITTYKLLQVKMVILQFGGNSVPYFKNETGVANYVNSFSRQIEHLKSVNPDIRILVIGPADMSYNEKGEMTTYPILESLVEQMRVAANNSGAAFWSMYDAMGGKNSMVKWVNEYPALAAPDYIHFTQRGSELIAKYFIESIEREYEIYRKKKLLNDK